VLFSEKCFEDKEDIVPMAEWENLEMFVEKVMDWSGMCICNEG